MSQKCRRFAAFLGSLLLAAFIVSVPALATGEGDPTPYTNDSGGIIVFPTESGPPTPTPTPTPTPVPTPTPTPVPTPTPAENTPSPATPTPNGNQGGNIGENTPTPTPTPNRGTPAPTVHPSTQPTPTTPPVVTRPSVTLKPSSAPEGPSVGGHNYVTFAQLNMKNNSLAITLFYGGAGCTAAGIAGLGTIVFLIFRGRSRDDKEIIFQEIQNAESRNNTHHISSTPQLMITPGRPQAVGPDPRRGPPPRPAKERERLPAPETLMPGKKDPNAPIVPVAASIYTEEFPLNEAEPAPVRPMASRLRQSRQAAPEKPASAAQSNDAPKSAPAPSPVKAPAEEAPPPPAPAVREAPKEAPPREEPKPVPPVKPAVQTQTMPTLEIPQVPPQAAKKPKPKADPAPIRPQPMPEETIEWTAERTKPKPKKKERKVSSVAIPEEAIPTGKKKKKSDNEVYQQESLFQSDPAPQPEAPPPPKEDEELPGQMHLF